MSKITFEIPDELREYVARQVDEGKFATVDDCCRTLMETGARLVKSELTELKRLLQEGEDSIVPGEDFEWKPGDGGRMFHEILERRKPEGKA